MLYFGYGSNMASDVMQAWCPDAQRIGIGRLKNYRLAFTRLSQRWGAGVADIVPGAGEVVYGVLYRISQRDLAALDKKESNGIGYQRISIEVLNARDEALQAVSYEVIDKLPVSVPTSAAYKETLLRGAKETAIPEDYIQMLEALPITSTE